jgi:hypothetical protein
MIITMFKHNCILIFLLLLTISISASASYEYAVIPTQQKAENILQQLKPLFPENTKFSAKDYQLIIKASPDIIKEIKYVLKQIDRPLRNLIISIANNKTIDKLLKSSYVSGKLTSKIKAEKKTTNEQYNNENTIGQDISKPSGGTVKITSTQRNYDSLQNGIYTARVVEGHWAYIYTGKQVPYYTITEQATNSPINSAVNKSYNYQVPQTQFKDVKSGFEAKAVLQTGNRVLIYIRSQNNQQNSTYQSNINSSSSYSTISGSLNEWLTISVINTGIITNKNNQHNMQQPYNGIQYRNRTNQTQETYYIKVNTVN